MPVYATGLQDLCEQVVATLGERGLIGVYVSPPPNEIDPDTGADLRPEGSTELHLVVHTGRVQGVRTFAAPAVPGAAPLPQEISNDHEEIAARSPLQPVGAGDPLNKNQLDAYLAGLNRLPGRMVDAVVTPTLTPGVVNLDYMVAEDRPWTVASDISNTGTEHDRRQPPALRLRELPALRPRRRAPARLRHLELLEPDERGVGLVRDARALRRPPARRASAAAGARTRRTSSASTRSW